MNICKYITIAAYYLSTHNSNAKVIIKNREYTEGTVKSVNNKDNLAPICYEKSNSGMIELGNNLVCFNIPIKMVMNKQPRN